MNVTNSTTRVAEDTEPAASLNGKNSITAGNNTNTMPLNASNTAGTIDNGHEGKTSWSNLFKDSPEKHFQLQYFKPDPNQGNIVPTIVCCSRGGTSGEFEWNFY